MSDALHVAVSADNGPSAVSVLHLSGPLDGKTYMALEDKANELIDSGVANMLLEMSKVSYIGSAGLRAIHTISNKLNTDEHATRSTNLKVVSPSKEVKKIFKTLGFDSYLEIFDDLDEAIESF